MKIEKIFLKAIFGFAFLALFTFLSSTSSYAAVNLPSINISKTSNSYSRTFSVTSTGELKVTVKVAVKGFFGSGGSSRYRVQLMRGSSVVDTEYVTTNTTFKNVYLRYLVSSCSKTGTYRVRIRNVSSVNPQPGVANFMPFNPPIAETKTFTLSQFGITQGNTLNRDIPEYREPKSGGRIEVTATWGSSCNLDPAGCRLLFRLKRNNTTVAYSSGYTWNTVFASNSKKMRIVYNIPASQVEGDWKLQVIGNQNGDAANVIPKIKFTPACK